MSSRPESLKAILKRLEPLEITYRKMMGEYLLYYQNRLFGGIYDDELLLKVLAECPISGLKKRSPYPGAKEMWSAQELEDGKLKDYILQMSRFIAPKKKSVEKSKKSQCKKVQN